MIDRQSPTWLSLKSKIEQRIEDLRGQLETIGLDPDPLRGEIAGLRWIIKTVEPDAPTPEKGGDDYLKTGGGVTPYRS